VVKYSTPVHTSVLDPKSIETELTTSGKLPRLVCIIRTSFNASQHPMDQGSSFLTPEYKSQNGSGTAVYHRFEDRSIILSRNHTYRGLYPQSHLCILGSSFLTPDPASWI